MELCLESSWTPLFLRHALSEQLSNTISKIYRLYIQNTFQIRPPLPIPMTTSQVQVTIISCLDYYKNILISCVGFMLLCNELLEI